MKKSTKEVVEQYPECEKLANVSKESNAIGEFLDWLQEQGISLTKWQEAGDNGEPSYIDETTGEPSSMLAYNSINNPDLEEWFEGYFPIHTPFENLLAKYFDIDMNKVEKERREMLDNIRKIAD